MLAHSNCSIFEAIRNKIHRELMVNSLLTLTDVNWLLIELLICWPYEFIFQLFEYDEV